jgi:glycosyltransferase involved in cell wall biosynthesis
LEARATELRLPNVVFIERQPSPAMPSWFACADVLVVHLKHTQVSDLVIPNKILAYLAAGRPIVTACDGAGGELAEMAAAGVVVRPGHPRGIADAVLRLLQLSPTERRALGEKGRDYVLRHHTKRGVVRDHERVLAMAAFHGLTTRRTAHLDQER